MMLLWERGREGGGEKGRERGSIEREGERMVERRGGRHSWPRDVLSNTVPYDAALGEG